MSSNSPFHRKIAPLPLNTITYRCLAMGLIITALLLAILTPHDHRRLRMPDPWAYETATQQFAQGQWVLTNDQAAQARTDVRLRGGTLDQYVPIGENQWAFRQSPGYPLLLVPFYKMGLPRLANLLPLLCAGLHGRPCHPCWGRVFKILGCGRRSRRATFLTIYCGCVTEFV